MGSFEAKVVAKARRAGHKKKIAPRETVTDCDLTKMANQNRDKDLKQVAWELRTARQRIRRFEERGFMDIIAELVEKEEKIEKLQARVTALQNGLAP